MKSRKLLSIKAHHWLLLILLVPCIGRMGMCANTPGLRIEGDGVFTDSLNPSSTEGSTTKFRFNAQIAFDGRYRLQVEYKNLHDTLVFDGTQTIAYRDIHNETGSSGADIHIVSGSSPEHLNGYVQAAWAASVFNTLHFAQDLSSTNISTNNLSFLRTPTFFRKNFGEELLAQLTTEIDKKPEEVRLSAYLPGDATRNGGRVFESPEYTNGLLFHQVQFRARDTSVGLYRSVTVVDYLAYGPPASRDDVSPVLTHAMEILRAESTDVLDLTLPALKTLVAITDYTRDYGSNDPNPAAYSISSWADLKDAQAIAHSVPSQRTSQGVLISLFALMVLAVPIVLWKILLTRRQQM